LASVVDDRHTLKERWLNRALERAGIDRRGWLPDCGVRQNRRTVDAVYEYYGHLFSEHPHLKWAGLANMVGPALVAGFLDIGWLPDVVRRTAAAVSPGRTQRWLAKGATGGLNFFATTFLRMQKQIFEDQAPMHEAYLDGGLPEIDKFYATRIIDLATLVAWQQIDAGHRGGDATLVDIGNRGLLFREQRDVLDPFYVRMLRHRPPGGALFTYALTLAGTPSFPGGNSYADRYPLTLMVRRRSSAISIGTPLADGNIAVFANRWKLIDDDTLPHFLAYVCDHADDARKLVEKPLPQRVRQYRLLARLGGLAVTASTHWSVALEAEPASTRRLAIRQGKPIAGSGTESAVIDLRRPPSRDSAGIAAGTRSRIWMNARRQPFDLTVQLPAGRVFRVEKVEIAVMLAETERGDPDRMTVRLPSADLDATSSILRDYAVEWVFPGDAIDDWLDRAIRRVSSDRDYSTHVFTPDPVEFVHLEFHVAHHVGAGRFVTSVLFSWGETTAGAKGT
jgi:hypothetical protein